MSAPATTRRDLLRFGTSAAAYAAGAAIVTGGIALASEAKGATPEADRRPWDAASKRCADAKAAYDRDCSIYDPAHDAWAASKPDGRNVDIRAFNMMPRARVLDTVDPDQYQREWLASTGETYFPNEREKAADLASIDSLRAFHRERAAHDERHRIDKLVDRNDALLDAWSDAQTELMAMPAPDVAALRWKLEHVLRRERDGCTTVWNHDYVAPILADVARLSGGEA